MKVKNVAFRILKYCKSCKLKIAENIAYIYFTFYFYKLWKSYDKRYVNGFRFNQKFILKIGKLYCVSN